MTNTKNTKRALLSSVMALFLCFAMLLGTTYAWFTDSVTSANNVIKSGNLDIELKYAKIDNGAITEWNTVQGKDNIFDKNALWEPGRVEVVYLEVSNLGTLALKYQLGVNVVNEIAGTNVEGDEFKLSDHLVFKVVDLDAKPTVAYTRDEAMAKAGTEKGLKDYNGATTPLEVGGTDYVALIVYMPESVGDEANYRGDKIPTIELGINLYATQQMDEEDSFGPDYDEYAGLPWDGESKEEPKTDENGVIHITNAAELVAIMDTTGNSIYSGKTIVLDADINLGGKTVKGIGGGSNFAGIFDGQGHTISNFTVNASDRDYYAGLFNQVSHGGTVKNLTVKGATIIGNSMVGAVASSVDSNAVIDNCKAIDCTLIGAKKVGAVVGYSAGSTVTNNYAENCKVYYGEKEGAEVLGFENTGSTVSNNTAKNVVVKFVVFNDEQLAKAIANPSVDLITVASGEYGVIDVRVNRNLTIVAQDGAVVKLAGINGQTNNNTTNLTIKGITIDNSLATEGWYIGTSQNMKPCVGVWGGSYTFENCTFYVSGESKSETGVMSWWTTNVGTMTFKNCTFNGGSSSARAMQIYGKYNLNVEGCTFNTAKDYSIKYVGSENLTATFKNNKVNNTVNFVQTGSAPYAGENYTLVFENNTLAAGINHVYVDNDENQIITINGNRWVGTTAQLSNAIAAGVTDIYLLDGEYYVPACQGKTITLNGGKGAVIKASVDSYGYQTLSGANITFNGVTIKGTDSNFTCKGFQHATVSFNDCVIVNELILNGDSVFTNCTFNTNGNIYSIWTWGARNATFTECTFNTDGKAILVYGGASGTPVGEITTVLTLNKCTFNDSGDLDAKKAAIEVGNGYTNANYKIVVKDTVVNGYEINDEGINTGTTLWGNKNSMGTDTLNVIVNDVDVY